MFNKGKLHITLLLALMCFFSQEPIGATGVQDPKSIRQFDNNFKDRYSGSTYNYQGKKEKKTTTESSGNYSDYTDKIPTIQEDNNGLSLNIIKSFIVLKWFFYLVLAIALLTLVYMLLNNGNNGFFVFKRNTNIKETNDITADNIQNTDLKSLIAHAENNKAFRLAIRYYFLLVLKNLSLKNHISIEDDKTNTEYLNELTGKPFQTEFNYNLYLYNYIWYGDFPLNAQQYNKAKAHFTTLLNRIK